MIKTFQVMSKIYFAYYLGLVFGVILTLIFQRFFV